MSWIATKPVPDMTAPIASVGYIGSVPHGEVRAPDHQAVVPQAFCVHMVPGGAPLRTHFHAVDQFQLVTLGSARLGNHEIVVGAIHYADRSTPYGPIEPGPEGTSFLTLRSASSAGAFYMPESREGLAHALSREPPQRPVNKRRNLSLDVESLRSAEPDVWHDLRADADGLRIAAADITASRQLTLDPVGGEGAYLVVIAGQVRAEETGTEALMPPGSIRWCDAGDEPRVEAGPEGARLALLQLPVRPPL